MYKEGVTYQLCALFFFPRVQHIYNSKNEFLFCCFWVLSIHASNEPETLLQRVVIFVKECRKESGSPLFFVVHIFNLNLLFNIYIFFFSLCSKIRKHIMKRCAMNRPTNQSSNSLSDQRCTSIFFLILLLSWSEIINMVYILKHFTICRHLGPYYFRKELVKGPDRICNILHEAGQWKWAWIIFRPT